MTLDDTNWTLVASVSKRPVHCQPRVIDLGRRFSSQYLIAQVSASNHKQTWNFGGEIWAGYLLKGQPNYTEKRKLIAESSNLVSFPLITTAKYSLFYEFPKWFDYVRIKVYEYTGDVDDQNSSENTNKVQEQLESIEDKINELKIVTDNVANQINSASSNNELSSEEDLIVDDYLLGYY